MLVAMSLMGATLMVIAAGDHKRNGNQNVKQQTFMLQRQVLQKLRNG